MRGGDDGTQETEHVQTEFEKLLSNRESVSQKNNTVHEKYVPVINNYRKLAYTYHQALNQHNNDESNAEVKEAKAKLDEAESSYKEASGALSAAQAEYDAAQTQVYNYIEAFLPNSDSYQALLKEYNEAYAAKDQTSAALSSYTGNDQSELKKMQDANNDAWQRYNDLENNLIQYILNVENGAQNQLNNDNTVTVDNAGLTESEIAQLNTALEKGVIVSGSDAVTEAYADTLAEAQKTYGNNVTAAPYLQIKVVEKNENGATYNIEPVYNVFRTNGEGEQLPLNGNTPLENTALKNSTEPIEMKLPVLGLPGGATTAYVVHKKDNGNTYIYTGNVKDSAVYFKNYNGFSQFTVSAEDPSVVKIGDVGYLNLQDAVDAVKEGETITVLKDDKDQLTAVVNSARSFSIAAADGVSLDNVKLTAGSGIDLVKNADGSYSASVKQTSNTSGTSSVVSTDNGVNIYRLFNPKSGEHLFTSDSHEYYVLGAGSEWDQEGLAWVAPTKSDNQVARLFDKVEGSHLYTTDQNEIDYLTKGNWIKDQMSFYSADSNGRKIYRLFDTVTGQHLLTTDENEKNVLTKGEWVLDETSIYALK